MESSKRVDAVAGPSIPDPWAQHPGRRPAAAVAIAAVAVGVVALLVLATLAMSPPGPEGTGIREGQIAPDFSIEDVNGTEWRLADHRGEVVLVDFMGVHCSSCEVEMRDGTLQAVHGTHAAHGFTILSIDIGTILGTEDPLEAWRFIEGIDASGTRRWEAGDWPIALDNQGLVSLYQVNPLPTKFLIDRTGRIAWVHVGLVTQSDLEGRVVPLLG